MRLQINTNLIIVHQVKQLDLVKLNYKSLNDIFLKMSLFLAK